MTTRIAVIGVGSIAVQHLISYQKNPHAELVAVCDIDRAGPRGEPTSSAYRGRRMSSTRS
jgi:predicted dehydrogenase